jgi:RimJ/RimL family protein N-acetyltransferase
MTPLPAWERAPEGVAAALAERFAAATPRIVTARLILRAPRIEDFGAYAEIVCGPRGVHVGGPMDRETAFLDFAQMVAGWLLRGCGLWSVETRTDAALVGFVQLGWEYGDPEAELGFLLRAEAEGRGYAREAAEAARLHAFGTLGWTSVVSYVDPQNARSVRLAERLGARLDPELFDGSRVYRHLPGGHA